MNVSASVARIADMNWMLFDRKTLWLNSTPFGSPVVPLE